jgi:putative ABC transport system permease protein
MDKLFLLKLAFKNLWLHKLRTFLTIGGIAVGISAMVFLLSFAFGLERLVTEQVTQGNAFRLIDVGTGDSAIVALDKQTLDRLKTLPNIADAQAIINAAALAQDGDRTLDVTFYGASNTYLDWSGVTVNAGRKFNETVTAKEILVNSAFIKFLGNNKPDSYLGQKVSFNIVLSAELTPNKQTQTISDQQFTIVGVVNDNNPASVYASENYLAPLTGNNFSQAKVEIADTNQITKTRTLIENLGFKTQYVGDTVTQINQIFAFFKIILGGFGLIAMIVAVLGMFNTLTISLLERMREVALMKILGMRRKNILQLFISEAIILGFIGGILGVAVGDLIAFLINAIFDKFAIRAGGSAINIFYLPWWFALIALGFALLVGFLTGLYPSYRASRVKFLDVMRYE